MMAEQPGQKRQSIFKIISLTKQSPIFIYRPVEPPEDKHSNSFLKMKRVKDQMQKVAARLSILAASPSRPAFLDKRSDSCDLSGRCKGKTERAELECSESRGKMQRSIKEYLRLAYKRAEVQRRTSSHKLPAITPHPSPDQRNKQQQEEEKKVSKDDMRSNATMKKILRRRGQQKQPEMVASFKPDLISGWQDFPSPEDF